MKALAGISSALLAVSTGRVALIGVVIFLAFGALVLPGQSAAAERASGGAGSPDTSFFYSPADLLQQAGAYGEAGRAAYVRARWTFDLAFPLVYGFFLVTSIGWAVRKSAPAGSPWHRLNLLPVAGVLFDYLENTATSLVMARFPVAPPLAAALAPWMTLLKWLFVYGSFGVLAVVLVTAWVKGLRRRPA